MNVAIIFAGGTGSRMGIQTMPKQFLESHGKPIIIHTLERFDRHEMIDGIVVVCIEEWIDYCKELIDRFKISKVSAVVPGGKTGMLSRYRGVSEAAKLYPGNTLCLMHDGVRPLIDRGTITKNIECAVKNGSAVTVSPAIETVAIKSDGSNRVGEIIDREKCQMAKAPQTFRLDELSAAHENAIECGTEDCIDTAYLMQLNGHDIYAVEGSHNNIKITTMADFHTFEALTGADEDSRK